MAMFDDFSWLHDGSIMVMMDLWPGDSSLAGFALPICESFSSILRKVQCEKSLISQRTMKIEEIGLI